MIAHGTLGQLGAHVQNHVAQVAKLAQGPRMGHIMVEAIAWDHHPICNHAMQIAALVGVNYGCEALQSIDHSLISGLNTLGVFCAAEPDNRLKNDQGSGSYFAGEKAM